MSKFFPVIHCQNAEQTYRNLNVAQEAGADGVFLINHKIPHVFLTLLAHQAVDKFPELPIGVNYLDLDPVSALAVIPEGVTGLWSDDPKIIENAYAQEAAQIFLDYRKARGCPVSFYGSVAFKYQPQPKSLWDMTKLASEYMEVVTTSGSATGSPPDFEKIMMMKHALGSKPLAIASGIDAKNVRDYLPYVNDFLVATSISSDFFNLDLAKAKELAEVIHGYVKKTI